MVAGALERLGQRIRLARKLRNLTQQDMADFADVSLSTMRALEGGADGVAIGNLLKVIQALGLLSQLERLVDPKLDPEAVAYAERKLRAK